MSKIFKPRRGLKSTMSGAKSGTVLAAGEMFVEFDSSVGGGTASVKFGDGTTAYSSLPYAIKGVTKDNVSATEVTVTADSSTTSTNALNNVTSNKTVGALVGSLKQAISLTKTELTNTIDGRLNTNNVGFYFDYKNSEYGWNSSSARGADTFHPFKSGTKVISGNIASGTQTISCGFRPSKIMIDCRYSNGEQSYSYYNGSGTSAGHTTGIGGNHQAHSFTINDDGFTTSISYSGTFIAIE